LFQKILGLIDDLRRRPIPAQVEETHNEPKMMGEMMAEMYIDAGKN